jgi:hypothetical protein
LKKPQKQTIVKGGNNTKKKAFFLSILIICAAVAFSQQVVGTIIINNPEIKVVIDFYDKNVAVDLIADIIKSHIISTGSKGLQSVSDEDTDIVWEELDRRYFSIDWSNIENRWGSVTEYFVTKCIFSFHGREYFIINVIPEDFFLCLENQK